MSAALELGKGEIGRSRIAAALWRVTLLTISACAICYAVYLAIKPVQWGDSGYFIGEFVSGQLTFSGPIAHPGYKIIAATVHELGGINALLALNAISNGLSSYLIFKVARRLGAAASSAWIGASVFFLSQPAFWLATNIEVYPLHNAVLLSGIYLLLRGCAPSGATRWHDYLAGSALITGAIAFHQLSALVLPALALDAIQRFGKPSNTGKFGHLPQHPAILASALIPAVAAAVTVVTVSSHWPWIAEYFGLPGIREGWSAKYFQVGEILRAPKYFLMAAYGIGFLFIAFAVPSKKDRRVRFLKIAAALQLAFVLTYDIPDRFQFLLPALSFLSILFALLLDRISGIRRTVLASATVLLPILVGAAVYASILPEALFPRHYRTNPYRNDVAYFLSPYFKEASAALFVSDLNAIVRQRTDRIVTFLADEWTPSEALASARATGYVQGVDTALTKDLHFGPDGCPSPSYDRLYIVFRRNDIAPMEERCLRELGRLLVVLDERAR